MPVGRACCQVLVGSSNDGHAARLLGWMLGPTSLTCQKAGRTVLYDVAGVAAQPLLACVTCCECGQYAVWQSCVVLADAVGQCLCWYVDGCSSVCVVSVVCCLQAGCPVGPSLGLWLLPAGTPAGALSANIMPAHVSAVAGGACGACCDKSLLNDICRVMRAAVAGVSGALLQSSVRQAGVC